MVLKGWLMSDYEEFVKSGVWFLDTEAPDYQEKLLKDVLEKQTPQVQAEQEQDKEWFTE
jgi:hypothetical protein